MKYLIVKVLFNCDMFWSDTEYEKLSELEKTKIINVEAISTFDYIDDENNYICYMIISPIEMSKYEGILLNLDIKYKANDIGDEILNGEIDLRDVFEKHKHPINMETYLDFFDNLEKWIMKNQTVDNVLDIINEKGYENLRSIDKDFLHEYSISLLKK
jgi:hypothetical protein